MASAFTVSGSGNFDVSQIDLGVTEGDLPNETFIASIWTDSSAQPGTQLGPSWTLRTTAT